MRQSPRTTAPTSTSWIAFESELDATFDPSPVEAYLAESEASLLEVAHGVRSPLPHVGLPPSRSSARIAASPPRPPPVPVSQAIETAGIEVSAGHEPVAFEADAEIAFEPAVEFAFDEAVELFFFFFFFLKRGGGGKKKKKKKKKRERVPQSTSTFDAYLHAAS